MYYLNNWISQVKGINSWFSHSKCNTKAPTDYQKEPELYIVTPSEWTLLLLLSQRPVHHPLPSEAQFLSGDLPHPLPTQCDAQGTWILTQGMDVWPKWSQWNILSWDLSPELCHEKTTQNRTEGIGGVTFLCSALRKRSNVSCCPCSWQLDSAAVHQSGKWVTQEAQTMEPSPHHVHSTCGHGEKWTRDILPREEPSFSFRRQCTWEKSSSTITTN